MEQPQNTTPGPWTAYGSRVYSTLSDLDAATAHGFDDRELNANARLIAAAPELYDALARLVECVEESDDPESRDVLADARAALRRAGRTA